MAHENFRERRKAVKEALDNNTLDTPNKKRLAELFDCTFTAIQNDVSVFKNGSIFNPSSGMKKRILARDGNVCYLCGKETSKPVIEHKIPARAGGMATEENLAVACASCNSKKRYRDALLY